MYGIAKTPHKHPKQTKNQTNKKTLKKKNIKKTHETTELTLKSNEFMLCELYFNERNACQVKNAIDYEGIQISQILNCEKDKTLEKKHESP